MVATQTQTHRGLAITIALTAATVGVVYGHDTVQGAAQDIVWRSQRDERSMA